MTISRYDTQQKRRVLLLTQTLPYPPDAGPKIKTFSLLKYLAGEGHDLVLVSFIRSKAEAGYLPELELYCQHVRMVPIHRSPARDLIYLARSLCGREPFLITRDRAEEFTRAVQSVMANHVFDLVHADQLNMAQFAIGLGGIPRVLDEHNAVWTIVQRLYEGQRPGLKKLLLYLESRKLKRYEGEVCRRFDHILAVSEQDRQALGEAGVDRKKITVVPIGVDCSGRERVQQRPEANNIVSLGTMFYPPNVEGVTWFAREVLPHIRARLPHTKFYIIGARPPGEVYRLAQTDDHVVVTGYVPDPMPFLKDAAALVVPLRSGGGMRVKILDAFAWGVPVVSTSVGCEGIDATPGKELLVADGPAAFAAATIRVIEDREYAHRMADNAYELVQRKYDWRTAYAEVGAVYRDVISGYETKRRASARTNPSIKGC